MVCATGEAALTGGDPDVVTGSIVSRWDYVVLEFVDTAAQIVAWALVFGYAQQLFTRLVDERGQAVLSAAGGPENPK